MAARRVGIYSVKGVNCTTSFESKENVRVEAIALIKGPFPFRTPVQIEKVKISIRSPKLNGLRLKPLKIQNDIGKPSNYLEDIPSLC